MVDSILKSIWRKIPALFHCSKWSKSYHRSLWTFWNDLGVPAGTDLVGNWNVDWSRNCYTSPRQLRQKSSYFIERSGNKVQMRILACNWRETCDENDKAYIQPSANFKYPHEEGWLQVENIHDGILTIYLKKEGDELKFVWYRPLTGYLNVGIGTTGNGLTKNTSFGERVTLHKYI